MNLEDVYKELKENPPEDALRSLAELTVSNQNLQETLEDYEAEIQELEKINKEKPKPSALDFSIDDAIYRLSRYFNLDPKILSMELRKMEHEFNNPRTVVTNITPSGSFNNLNYNLTTKQSYIPIYNP